MTAQTLDRGLSLYRIGDAEGEFAIFSSEGARRYPGRWNTSAAPLVYACEHFATAMLEKLAVHRSSMPLNQHWIEIEVDAGLSYEVFVPENCPGWDSPDKLASRTYGAAWAQARRSLLLFVPSVVARIERNVLINPAHPEFARVRHGLHQPVWWDGRLFSRGDDRGLPASPIA